MIRRVLNDRRNLLVLYLLTVTLIVLQVHFALFPLTHFSPFPQQAATTLAQHHHSSSALVHRTIPLGCSADSHLQAYLSQHQGDVAEQHRLLQQALEEQNVPPTPGHHCDLLLPLAYAQQALQKKITLQGSMASQIKTFLPLNVTETSKLWQVIAACLSRTMFIISSDNDELKVLCLHLRLAFYLRKKHNLFLCGSTIQTRCVADTTMTDTTLNNDDCVLVKQDAHLDFGQVDSDFDVTIQNFFLHCVAVSKLQGKPIVVSTTSKHTLGVYVSGNGRVSNGGDLFGPLVASHVLRRRNQTNVTVAIGEQNTDIPPAISIVGSTLQGTMRLGKLVAWGTGIIKNEIKVAKLAPSSKVVAVRGPKTRNLLLAQHGLNPMVISDPALIARDFGIVSKSAANTQRRRRPVCFVIHGVDREYATKKCPFCMDRLVNNYNRDPLIILETLSECQRVVSSSLHGCIFSHALGIPALPISLGERITGGDFKFIDYMHSVGVTSFQKRVNITRIWEQENGSNKLTENDWKRMVDETVQPRFPISTEHFYETFPIVA